MASNAAGTADIETGMREVEAQIRYLSDDSWINRRYVSPGVEVNTGQYEDHRVTIRDGRPIARHFELDTHGFILADHVSSVTDFHNREMVDNIYATEAAALVKKLTGAREVLTQGWMIRTSADIPKAENTKGYKHVGGIQPPAGEAHVDYTPDTGPRTAERIYRQHHPDGAGYGRFICFSLWRTFSPPPQDVPLAVCDGRSIDDSEGRPNTLHIVDTIPSEAEMRAPLENEKDLIAASIFPYQPQHRWWYFSHMTRDEVLLFKFFDSDHSGAWRCMHTAFRDSSFADANKRASIEMRLVAYFDA